MSGVLLNSERVLTDADVAALPLRYRDWPVAGLGYGTVADYCDSVDVIGQLATRNGDMKDLQRCWTIKAILGRVPRGGRLVEIGAGEPIVADILARAGYDVTVFDPYDGSAGGPAVGDAFAAFYPRLTFRRELFGGGAQVPDGTVDGFYSISVVEHVPAEDRRRLWDSVRRALTPGGLSIHAIDCVLAGEGAEFHKDMVTDVAAAHGYRVDDIEVLLATAGSDPDCYFLSAEAHDRWRGGRPYGEFPMRRVMSVQLCGRPAP